MVHRVDVTRRQWREPTADELERGLRELVEEISREAMKLGRCARDSAMYATQRAKLVRLWSQVPQTIALLRNETSRETKRATKDALHGKLRELGRAAEPAANGIQRPYVSWKRAVDDVMDWLDRWTC